jgi:hypothetical protein
MRQGFVASAKDLGCAKVLTSAKDFEGANIFCIRRVFLDAPMFLYIFCDTYIFVYFSALLFNMRQ